VGNASMNVYAKFRGTPLCIKKAFRDFWTLRDLITGPKMLGLNNI